MFKKVMLSIAIMFVMVVVIIVSQYINAHNTAVSKEESTKSTYMQYKNSRTSYVNRIMEMMQVPDMMVDNTIKVIEANLEGRYGENGNQAVMSFIAENNIGLEAGIHTRLMNEMNAGRRDIQVMGDRIEEIKRSYRTDLRSFWRGKMMRAQGFPTINIGHNGMPDDFPILLSDETRTAFESGTDNAIQFRQN